MSSIITALALVLLSILLPGTPSFATGKDDPCREKGIIVKNLTTRDLWRKTDGGGACYLWDENKTFSIKADEKIGIFSDLVCETNYCRDNPTYKGYKATDSNGDCRIRILPECRLSDM